MVSDVSIETADFAVSGTLYDQLAAGYEEGANPRFYRRIAELIAPEFAGAMTGRALDLGCGSGISTETWARASTQLSWTGLDPSPAMLGLARAKQAPRELRYLLGRGESLPFRDGEFSAVGSSFALHWMREDALLEARRVLQPGGILALAVPLPTTGSKRNGNLWLKRWLWSERARVAPLRSQGMCLDELEASMKGWRIERSETVALIERFESFDALWRALQRRGSLTAILGREPAHPAHLQPCAGPVEFEWRIGILAARALPSA